MKHKFHNDLKLYLIYEKHRLVLFVLCFISYAVAKKNKSVLVFNTHSLLRNWIYLSNIINVRQLSMWIHTNRNHTIYDTRIMMIFIMPQTILNLHIKWIPFNIGITLTVACLLLGCIFDLVYQIFLILFTYYLYKSKFCFDSFWRVFCSILHSYSNE